MSIIKQTIKQTKAPHRQQKKKISIEKVEPLKPCATIVDHNMAVPQKIKNGITI